MADPAGELQVKLVAALRADAGVIAAFGPNPVRAYVIPPVNAVEPYLIVGQDHVLAEAAECMDLTDTEATVHVWSLTDPPGLLECKRIGAAVLAVMLALPDLPSHFMQSAQATRSEYMVDTDERSAHGVIAVSYSTEARSR